MKTYYVTHVITITHEVPARSKASAEKSYMETIGDAESFKAIADEGCTSTSSTQWEIEVRDADEQAEHESSDE